MKNITISTLLIANIACISTVSATSIANDSFLIDGSNYTADATINGVSPDTTAPFATTDAWATDAVSGDVNFTARNGSLGYSTTGESLNTSGGNLDVFRTTGASGNKNGGRAAASPITSSPWTEVYFSVVVNVDNATLTGAESFTFNWDHDLSGARRFGFALQGSNDIITFQGESGGLADVDSGLSLAAGNNLLVFRVTDKTSGGLDEFELWLNPTDLSAEGAADYSVTIGSGLVVGNAGFGFDRLNISQNFDGAGDSVLIDEFRMGTTWADAVPFTAIPEPGTYALFSGLLALGFIMIRRR